MGLIGTRKEKGIWVREYTLWTKIQIAVLAYFARNNNKPATYTEISRAYTSSSYSNYQRACEKLKERGYLERLKDGSFKVRKNRWSNAKKGTEVVERGLPYFDVYMKKLNKH